MNRLCKTVSAQLIIVLGLIMPLGLFAQKESKTYEERYNVSEDAVLEINTSYADIEFETWGKDEVSITATITLEGATEEEAQDYFNANPIEILGNSKAISITSKSKNNRFFALEGTEFEFDHNDMHIEIPEVASFVMNMPQVAPFPEMPPLPQTDAFIFDHEAFEKDGEKYMKEWQKKFVKSFDKEHQKQLEEWAEKIEERAEEMEQRIEERNEQRIKRMEERAVEMEERLKEREAARAKQMVKRDSIRKRFFVRRDSLRSAPSIFYLNRNEGPKNYKIKKTIKISLPKSTRIKMDVRHGEVKLAANTKNLNAKLSHSSLWAERIDGEETNVRASYSPVTVRQWTHGQLSTSYSEQIFLAQVAQLQLETVSSDVTIEKLLKSALIKNNFGAVHILELDPDFTELDISLKNAELSLALPQVASDIYIKGNSSTLSKPKELSLNKSNNGSTTINKGYHLKNNSGRSIMITADYSEIVVE